MKNKKINLIFIFTVFFLGIMLFGGKKSLPFLVPIVFAHCDTMDGPVVKDARKALETGKIDIILKWVQKADEEDIKKAFEKTLSIRKLNSEAKEFADVYFFETLVRIHRAGEGAPYTGLKTEAVEPIVALADKAIETESVDDLAKKVSIHLTDGINKRFNHLMVKKKNINKNVEAGREYVEAYVIFVHYVEKLHLDASTEMDHHGKTEGGNVKEHHEH